MCPYRLALSAANFSTTNNTFRTKTDASFSDDSEQSEINLKTLQNNRLSHPGIVNFPRITKDVVVVVLSYWGRIMLGQIRLGEGKLGGPSNIIFKYSYRCPMYIAEGYTYRNDKFIIRDIILLRQKTSYEKREMCNVINFPDFSQLRFS